MADVDRQKIIYEKLLRKKRTLLQCVINCVEELVNICISKQIGEQVLNFKFKNYKKIWKASTTFFRFYNFLISKNIKNRKSEDQILNLKIFKKLVLTFWV